LGKNLAKSPHTDLFPLKAINDLRTNLLAWYDQNRRDLPWRRTRDPYAIWISEIMLQQTRVAAVIDRYHAFLRNFPSVQALAHAAEADVFALERPGLLSPRPHAAQSGKSGCFGAGRHHAGHRPPCASSLVSALTLPRRLPASPTGAGRRSRRKCRASGSAPGWLGQRWRAKANPNWLVTSVN
jgi:hypothetical protein